MSTGNAGGLTPTGLVASSIVQQQQTQNADQKQAVGGMPGRKVIELSDKKYVNMARTAINKAVTAKAQENTPQHSVKVAGQNGKITAARSGTGVGEPKFVRTSKEAKQVVKGASKHLEKSNKELDSSLDAALNNKGIPRLNKDISDIAHQKQKLVDAKSFLTDEKEIAKVDAQINRCDQLLAKAQMVRDVSAMTEKVNWELSAEGGSDEDKAIGLANGQKGVNELREKVKGVKDPVMKGILGSYADRAQKRIDKEAKSTWKIGRFDKPRTKLAKRLASALHQTPADPAKLAKISRTLVEAESGEKSLGRGGDLVDLTQDYLDVHGWTIGMGTVPDNPSEEQTNLLHDNIQMLSYKVSDTKDPDLKLKYYEKLLDLYETSRTNKAINTPIKSFQAVREARNSIVKKTSPGFKQQELRRLMVDNKDAAVKHLLKMSSEGIDPLDSGVWKELEPEIQKEVNGSIQKATNAAQFEKIREEISSLSKKGVDVSAQFNEISAKQRGDVKGAMQVLRNSKEISNSELKLIEEFLDKGEMPSAKVRKEKGVGFTVKKGVDRFEKRIERLCEKAMNSKDPKIVAAAESVLIGVENKIKEKVGKTPVDPYIAKYNLQAPEIHKVQARSYLQVQRQLQTEQKQAEVSVSSAENFRESVGNTIEGSGMRILPPEPGKPYRLGFPQFTIPGVTYNDKDGSTTFTEESGIDPSQSGLLKKQVKGVWKTSEEIISQQFTVTQGLHELLTNLEGMRAHFEGDNEALFALNEFIAQVSELATVYDAFVEDLLQTVADLTKDPITSKEEMGDVCERLMDCIGEKFQKHMPSLSGKITDISSFNKMTDKAEINNKFDDVFNNTVIADRLTEAADQGRDITTVDSNKISAQLSSIFQQAPRWVLTLKEVGIKQEDDTILRTDELGGALAKAADLGVGVNRAVSDFEKDVGLVSFY